MLDLFASIADICDVPTPGGAFYCLPRVRTPLTAMTVMQRLVREHKVAAIAGETFGLTEGCYLRVSYGALAGGDGEGGDASAGYGAAQGVRGRNAQCRMHKCSYRSGFLVPGAPSVPGPVPCRLVRLGPGASVRVGCQCGPSPPTGTGSPTPERRAREPKMETPRPEVPGVPRAVPT